MGNIVPSSAPFMPESENPIAEREVLTPSSLNRLARDLIEDALPLIWIEGELSNLVRSGPGHLYFKLKDSAAFVQCAMFKPRSTWLRFRPADGMHVLARGRVSLYESRGEFQIIVEHLEEAGEGALRREFEQLKARLQAEGLFDSARKRALPRFARRIGVVTSPSGAAIRDVLSVIERRFRLVEIEIIPVPVQGRDAPFEIAEAIRLTSSARRHDVLLVTRGGGSLEDLAPFNSERVARAIVASRLPVVSAIGHETDFTIADFAADLRAPTPSAAAELITEAQHDIAEYLAQLSHRLERAARFQILQARQRLSRVPASRTESRMATMLHRLEQRLDDLGFRLENAVRQQIRSRQSSVAELSRAMMRHDPRQQLAHARGHFEVCRARLDRTLERTIEAGRARLGALDAQLNSLSPLRVLDRGYALVLDAQGVVVRSAQQVAPGDQVRTRLSDGSFTSRVTEIRKHGTANRE